MAVVRQWGGGGCQPRDSRFIYLDGTFCYLIHSPVLTRSKSSPALPFSCKLKANNRFPESHLPTFAAKLVSLEKNVAGHKARALISSPAAFLGEISSHLLTLKGKLMEMLLLTSGEFCAGCRPPPSLSFCCRRIVGGWI